MCFSHKRLFFKQMHSVNAFFTIVSVWCVLFVLLPPHIKDSIGNGIFGCAQVIGRPECPSGLASFIGSMQVEIQYDHLFQFAVQAVFLDMIFVPYVLCWHTWNRFIGHLDDDGLHYGTARRFPTDPYRNIKKIHFKRMYVDDTPHVRVFCWVEGVYDDHAECERYWSFLSSDNTCVVYDNTDRMGIVVTQPYFPSCDDPTLFYFLPERNVGLTIEYKFEPPILAIDNFHNMSFRQQLFSTIDNSDNFHNMSLGQKFLQHQIYATHSCS